MQKFDSHENQQWIWYPKWHNVYTENNEWVHLVDLIHHDMMMEQRKTILLLAMLLVDKIYIYIEMCLSINLFTLSNFSSSMDHDEIDFRL